MVYTQTLKLGYGTPFKARDILDAATFSYSLHPDPNEANRFQNACLEMEASTKLSTAMAATALILGTPKMKTGDVCMKHGTENVPVSVIILSVPSVREVSSAVEYTK